MRAFSSLRRLIAARSTPRVRRALLKIDGRSIEVILRADPVLAGTLALGDPVTVGLAAEHVLLFDAAGRRLRPRKAQP